MKSCSRSNSMGHSAMISDERNKLSCHLHDNLGQEMVCLKMAAYRLSGQIEKSGSPEAQHQMNDMMVIIKRILNSLREMAKEIKPRVLAEFGLIAAIENEVLEIRRSKGVSILVEAETNELCFNPTMELEVLKVLRESLLALTDSDPGSSFILNLSKDDAFGKISIKQVMTQKEKFSPAMNTRLAELKVRIMVLGGEMTTLFRNRKLRIDLTIPLFAQN